MTNYLENLAQLFTSESFWNGLIRTPFILLGAWVISWLIRQFFNRLESRLIKQAALHGDDQFETKKRIETLIKLIRQIVKVSIWAMAFLVTLKEFNIDIRPLLTSVGIFGVAVGFGAQNLIKDLISGFFMILENQVRVGDSVTLNNVSGCVERINLRTIVLRDINGAVHYFPNGSITSLSNQTKDWSAYIFQFNLTYETSIDLCIESIQKAMDQIKSDPIINDLILNDEIFGVDLLDVSSIRIRGRIKTKAGQQALVGRKFLKIAKEMMDEAGIQFPSSTTKIILEK